MPTPAAVPQLAETDAQIAACMPVMRELRPHLTTAELFVERVRRQNRQAGYRLAFVQPAGEAVAAVAGFRLGEYLAWGMAMYIDDLSTSAGQRSKGYGGVLLEWLFEYARGQNCDQVHLDSGVQRFDAHRFYLLHRMDITSHHFVRKLRESAVPLIAPPTR